MIDELTRDRDYFGTCVNTFYEEQKHYVYAKLMGLKETSGRITLSKPTKVLDIGGGPVSLMLKCKNLEGGTVIDPIQFPDWTVERYKSINVNVIVDKAEYVDFGDDYDEVWIYNVLKNATDPERIISKAKESARRLRLFEWVGMEESGVKQNLTEELLNAWIGQRGKTVQLSQRHCYGRAYFGNFGGW